TARRGRSRLVVSNGILVAATRESTLLFVLRRFGHARRSVAEWPTLTRHRQHVSPLSARRRVPPSAAQRLSARLSRACPSAHSETSPAALEDEPGRAATAALAAHDASGAHPRLVACRAASRSM